MKRPHLIYTSNFVCYLENDAMLDTHFKALQRAFKELNIPYARLAKLPRHSDRKGLYRMLRLKPSYVLRPPNKYAEYFGIYIKWETPKGKPWNCWYSTANDEDVIRKIKWFTNKTRPMSVPR